MIVITKTRDETRDGPRWRRTGKTLARRMKIPSTRRERAVPLPLPPGHPCALVKGRTDIGRRPRCRKRRSPLWLIHYHADVQVIMFHVPDAPMSHSTTRCGGPLGRSLSGTVRARIPLAGNERVCERGLRAYHYA